MPRARRPHARVDLRIPQAWMQMADQLALMTDQSRTAYIRDALIRQMTTDWQLTPGRGFWVRPNSAVFRRDDRGFRQVATTLGGERIWPIENLGQLPASLGGGLAFRCDVVPVGMAEGLTMTDAIVRREDFGGPVSPRADC